MTLNGQAKVSNKLDTFRRIRGFARRFDEAQIEIDVDAIGVQSFQLATRSISKASLKPRGRRSKTWLALFEHDNLSVKKKSDGSSKLPIDAFGTTFADIFQQEEFLIREKNRGNSNYLAINIETNKIT